MWVHRESLTSQQEMMTAVAETQHTVLAARGQRSGPDEPACAALRIVPFFDRPAQGRTPRGGRQKYLVSICLRVALLRTGQELLQLAVLVFERFEELRVRDLQTASL